MENENFSLGEMEGVEWTESKQQLHVMNKMDKIIAAER